MAVTYKDWHEMLSLLQYTFQQGQPPRSFPKVYNMKGHASSGSQGPFNRSSAGIQAWPN